MDRSIEFSVVLIVLKDKGVSTMTVDFNGGGDSGEIEDITFKDIKGDIIDITDIGGTLYDQATEVAYCMLEGIEDWWNNEGGYGTLLVDLEEGSYEIEVNIRITDTEYYSHSGKVSEKLN